MKQRIEDSVVVITGASSGIGRGTAQELARRGARLALAARSEEPLRQAAAECEALGGRAVAVPTDVTDQEQVNRLARTAVDAYGRFDVWINNAAVTSFGRFEESPWDVYRRVIETDLFGYIHGARAAVPQFREQGKGVLINVGSMVGKGAIPYVSAYVTAKFGIYGFSESLREELLEESDIDVCTVVLPSVDTPLFQHAANYTGRAVKPMEPVYPVERAISGIIDCIEHPRPEVYVGAATRTSVLLHAVSPRIFQTVAARQTKRDHFQDTASSPNPGNVFEPMPQVSGVSGGWRDEKPENQSRLPLMLIGAAALAVPALIWFWQRRRRRRSGILGELERRGMIPRGQNIPGPRIRAKGMKRRLEQGRVAASSVLRRMPFGNGSRPRGMIERARSAFR